MKFIGSRSRWDTLAVQMEGLSGGACMLVQNAWNFKMLYRLYIHFWLNVKSDNLLNSICFPPAIDLVRDQYVPPQPKIVHDDSKEALKGL